MMLWAFVFGWHGSIEGRMNGRSLSTIIHENEYGIGFQMPRKSGMCRPRALMRNHNLGIMWKGKRLVAVIRFFVDNDTTMCHISYMSF
jgi:hypothetical protein